MKHLTYICEFIGLILHCSCTMGSKKLYEFNKDGFLNLFEDYDGICKLNIKKFFYILQKDLNSDPRNDIIILSPNYPENNEIDIKRFKNLTHLVFNTDQLSTYADSWKFLPKLKHIDVSKTNIYYFDTEIFDLPNLESLMAASCSITYLSSNICKLKNLKQLDLSGNCLLKIPPEIIFNQNLEWIDLSNNPLRSLPRSIFHLENLKHCSIRHLHFDIYGLGDSIGMVEFAFFIEENRDKINFKNENIFVLNKISLGNIFQLKGIKVENNWKDCAIKDLKLSYRITKSNSFNTIIAWKNICRSLKISKGIFLLYLENLLYKRKCYSIGIYPMYSHMSFLVKSLIKSIISRILSFQEYEIFVPLLEKLPFYTPSIQIVVIYNIYCKIVNNENIDYENLFKNSFIILKEYVFSFTICPYKCDRKNLTVWKKFLKTKLGLDLTDLSKYDNKNRIQEENSDESSEEIILRAFYSKFNVEYFCSTVSTVINHFFKKETLFNIYSNLSADEKLSRSELAEFFGIQSISETYIPVSIGPLAVRYFIDKLDYLADIK